MTKLGEEFYQSSPALKTELSGSKTSVDMDVIDGKDSTVVSIKHANCCNF
jgi:hypothetical protein